VPEPKPIDDDLLNALRTGDTCALGRVYEVYSGMVYRIALRFTKSEVDAEDVLQDVFVALPETVGGFKTATAFEAWLKRMAVRTSLMKLRSSSRQTRFESRLEAHAEFDKSEGDALDRFELEQGIERLPDALRFVFVLREIEGFKHAEIATMLNISIRASHVRMNRARARLRLLLSR